ncbi:hypothetical protein Emed_004339 [Eimeria media]
MEQAEQQSKQQQQQQKKQQKGKPLPLPGFSNGSKAQQSSSSPAKAAAAAGAKSPPLAKTPTVAPPAAAAAAAAASSSQSSKQNDAMSWRVRRRPPAFVSPENGTPIVQPQKPSDLVTQENPGDRASAKTGGRSRDRSSASAAAAATATAAAAAAAGVTQQPAHFPPPPMPPYRKERSSGSLRAPIIFSLCFPGWFNRQTAGKGVKIPKADVRIDPPPELVPFLPPQLPKDQQQQIALKAAAAAAAAPQLLQGKKTLVLDLDETLVRSTFAKPSVYTFIIKVDLDGKERPIYINKRPGVTLFLNEVAKLFEVVIFTASVSKYADPVMDKLDPTKLCSWRLFREYCTYIDGVFVKDLSLLGRDLKNIIIIDNSTRAYLWHAENAIPIKSWFEDPHDRELLDLIPILQSLASVSLKALACARHSSGDPRRSSPSELSFSRQHEENLKHNLQQQQQQQQQLLLLLLLLLLQQLLLLLLLLLVLYLNPGKSQRSSSSSSSSSRCMHACMHLQQRQQHEQQQHQQHEQQQQQQQQIRSCSSRRM